MGTQMEHCWTLNTSGNVSLATPAVVGSSVSFLSIFQATILIMNSVLIIPGNIINILVLTQLKNMNETTKLLLLYLAVVDLTTGILNAVFSVPSALTGQWLFGDVLCKFVGIMYPITCDSSLLALTLVSLDRYVAITRPLRYLQIVTRRRVLICLVSVSLSIPVFMYIFSTVRYPFDNIKFKPNAASCLIDFSHTCIAIKTIVLSCTLVLLPLVFIYIIYGRILFICYRVAKEVAHLDATNRDQRGFSRAEWKATKTTLVVTGAFTVAWLPLLVTTLYTAGVGAQMKPGVAFVAVILPTMNSWWNFFIYSVFNRQFRHTFINKYVPKLFAIQNRHLDEFQSSTQ